MNQLRFNISTISRKSLLFCILPALLFLLNLPFSASGQELDLVKDLLNSKFNTKRSTDFYAGTQNYLNGKRIVVDSVYYSAQNDTVIFVFNKALAEMPVRNEDVNALSESIKTYLPDTLRNTLVKIICNNVEFDELIPNYYRSSNNRNEDRLTPKGHLTRKNVVSPQRLFDIPSGLKNSNIALWNSHGWYYEAKLDRWEWQRARLFTSLEDISPTVFITPFISPMLENAGANVFIPRERDWQCNEVIVDNNSSTGKSKFVKPKKRKNEFVGFAKGNGVYNDENPFELGTSIVFESSKKENKASYIPDIPETGEYAVYVSYGKGDGEVTYRVHHSGGVSDFTVDQQMGFGTWIYLDKFHFKKGINKKDSKVELIVAEGSNQQFSADAVRFGGGMGVIERNGKIGGRAKYFEGARYYLQYSGAPDTLVWELYDNDDYKDDYVSRGEWVDWLMGAPFGPAKNRQHPGLKVPIDMAFAFHTDAGILPDDKIIGTLGIYSTDREESHKFPGGQSKYASRDLTDLIQTQIVDDINSIYKCNWKRRGMWNSQYSEAYRPQVPTMLLELLSHQNLNDVKYVLHPQFRFDVSRAIYKGMLRFISTQNGYDYVVQPLPVDHLSSEFVGENSIQLKWKPVLDEIEATAIPEKYMVYRRIGDNGFDNGTLVEKPELIISNIEKGKVYGFKVTAVNAGGESFPSEIISAGIPERSKGEILIVNGFDRVDGPAIIESDSFSGVLRQLDHGVAYGYDISTTGDQYDFDKQSQWIDDDSPGHGASYGDLETTVFRGNTFDFSYSHGVSILNAGYSVVTCSDEAVEDGIVDLNKYELVDLLYGEEKTSYLPGKDNSPYFEIYTDKMISALNVYTNNGGNVLISGANIGSDISKEKEVVKKVGEVLKFKWRTNHAVKNGSFYSVVKNINFDGEFNTEYNEKQYPVEAPDGIEAFDKNGETILRYGENNVSAAVFYNGGYKVVALGFPFESVKGDLQRDILMKQLLNKLIEK